ncbi:MAG: hypothetical protein IPJ55_09110 [Chloracidobacterium sp.]|nr:hypothetical protein [Chloracidobacterium sp.]
MAIDFLINPDGDAFNDEELEDLQAELAALNSADRFIFRNENADAISQCEKAKSLIVSMGKTWWQLRRVWILGTIRGEPLQNNSTIVSSGIGD